MFYKKRNEGFTLIELLLIIAIIGLLYSVIMSNLKDARQSGRDAAMKQQMRTMSTLFEYERNKTGAYQNYNLGRVGNDGTAQTCADKAFQGEFANKLRELCEGIVQQAEYTSDGIFNIQVADPPFGDGNHFSLMARLNKGEDWYCIGSNGGVSQGTLNPLANGCSANP